MTRIERAASRRWRPRDGGVAPRPVAMVELIATVALALSTVVAATAVSIGIARADAFGIRADGDPAPLAIALLIGFAVVRRWAGSRHHGGRPEGESVSYVGCCVWFLTQACVAMLESSRAVHSCRSVAQPCTARGDLPMKLPAAAAAPLLAGRKRDPVAGPAAVPAVRRAAGRTT